MALDKAVDSAVLDAGLKRVADAIRAKGGMTDNLVFPDGMESAVNAIDKGVKVQTASGSVTTTSAGKATMDIGFKPDLLVLKVGTISGYECNLNLALTEKWTTSKACCVSWYGDEYMYEASVDSVGATSTSVYVTGYDSSWNNGAASKITFQWKAVKYTA